MGEPRLADAAIKLETVCADALQVRKDNPPTHCNAGVFLEETIRSGQSSLRWFLGGVAFVDVDLVALCSGGRRLLRTWRASVRTQSTLKATSVNPGTA